MSIYRNLKYEKCKCPVLYFFLNETIYVYNRKINDGIFVWFDNIFKHYINSDGLLIEEITWLNKMCVKSFRELLFIKIHSFNNHVSNSTLKLLSYGAASLTLKYFLGYDWLYEEENIILDMVGNKITCKITCKNIVDIEYDLLFDFLNLKVIKKLLNPDLLNHDLLNQDLLNQDLLNQDLLNPDLLN